MNEPWRPNPTGIVGHNQVRADELYRENAKRERDLILAIAAKLARCEPLTDSEAPFAARVLRHIANEMPLTPPTTRGHQAELEPDALGLSFAHKVVALGMSEAAARDELATVAGVSIQAIKKALKQTGPKWCQAYRSAGVTKEALDRAPKDATKES